MTDLPRQALHALDERAAVPTGRAYLEDAPLMIQLAVEPYVGTAVNHCPAGVYSLHGSFAVTVSGAVWNPCGHLLLNAGGRGGHYFHVAERKGYPRMLDEAGYRRYLKEHGKREMIRAHVPLPTPLGALLKLEELLSKPWSWWVLPNNCTSFVEDVFRAGGSQAGLLFNCPTREYFI